MGKAAADGANSVLRWLIAMDGNPHHPFRRTYSIWFRARPSRCRFLLRDTFPIGPSARHLFKLILCKPGSSIHHPTICKVQCDSLIPWGQGDNPGFSSACQITVITPHYTNWAWTLKKASRRLPNPDDNGNKN